MAKTSYSRKPWEQFIQRMQEIPRSSWRTDNEDSMIKCRKHTDLVMNALRDTADNTGHIALYFFLLRCCK